MVDFVGPRHKDIVGKAYSANAEELIGAMKSLGWPKEGSIPGEPVSSSMAELNVRHIKEGT